MGVATDLAPQRYILIALCVCLCSSSAVLMLIYLKVLGAIRLGAAFSPSTANSFRKTLCASNAPLASCPENWYGTQLTNALHQPPQHVVGGVRAGSQHGRTCAPRCLKTGTDAKVLRTKLQ